MRLLLVVAAMASSWSIAAEHRLPPWPESYAAEVLARAKGPKSAEADSARIEIQQHAWDLLNVVMSDSRYPQWYWHWCTLDEVYKRMPCAPAHHSTVTLSPERAAGAPRAPLGTILSTAYYNESMTKYIQGALSSSSYSWPRPDWAAGLPALSFTGPGLLELPGQTMRKLAELFSMGMDRWEIPPIPSDAMIVKPAWYLVNCPQKAPPEIGLWDDNDPQIQSGSWLPEKSIRPRKISPRTLNQAPCTVPEPLLSLDDKDMLPRNDFFYFHALEETFAFRVEGATQWSMGDYLFLVGLHVISREQPNWTWTTFWWDENPKEIEGRSPEQAANRKLRHFNMRTTLALDEHPTPVFNPYLEGRLAGGLKSNCIACHQSAAARVDASSGRVSIEVPAAALPQTAPPPPECKDRICTSFIWSLPRMAKDHQ